MYILFFLVYPFGQAIYIIWRPPLVILVLGRRTVIQHRGHCQAGQGVKMKGVKRANSV